MSDSLGPGHSLSSDDPDERGENARMPFGRAIGLTVLGALVPGFGLIGAGRRKAGLTVLVVFLALAGGAAYLVTSGQRTVLHWAVQPEALQILGIALPALGLAWVVVIAATFRSLGPWPAGPVRRVVSYGLVSVLILLAMVPLSVAGRYALIQKGVVEHVFADRESRSATRPTKVTPADPWAGESRVNVLLLGGDGGPDRVGVRPDTIVLASIDTRTGATVLFSLPRNLRYVPFAPGTALANAYPHGVYAGGGDQLEWMLNSIYENVPEQNPGLLKSDNPGADATKLAVSGALGLKVDYYVLVNLKGFQQLIDALGGITVNVNHRVAKGGEADAGLVPGGWIEPGPDQHLDGFDALWFARGRYGADDYQRMGRQRCVIQAIIDQADPVRLTTRYEALARTSRDLVSTDIPASLLPAFVDLSLRVKGASVTSISFTNEVIDPSLPDYEKVHSLVLEEVRASGTSKDTSMFGTSLRDACAYSPEG